MDFEPELDWRKVLAEAWKVAEDRVIKVAFGIGLIAAVPGLDASLHFFTAVRGG